MYYRGATTSRNQITMIKQNRKGKTRRYGKAKHHLRRVKKKKRTEIQEWTIRIPQSFRYSIPTRYTTSNSAAQSSKQLYYDAV